MGPGEVFVKNRQTGNRVATNQPTCQASVPKEGTNARKMLEPEAIPDGGGTVRGTPTEPNGSDTPVDFRDLTDGIHTPHPGQAVLPAAFRYRRGSN